MTFTTKTECFSHFAAAAKSLQSCRTPCDPMDGSPPGSPVPGILQARTLEWVAISFSNAWQWKVNVKSLSRVRLLATPWTVAYQASPSMGFSHFSLHQNEPEGLFKHWLLGPIPRVSDKVAVGRNPRICISNKFPNNAAVAGQGNPLRTIPRGAHRLWKDS